MSNVQNGRSGLRVVILFVLFFNSLAKLGVLVEPPSPYSSPHPYLYTLIGVLFAACIAFFQWLFSLRRIVIKNISFWVVMSGMAGGIIALLIQFGYISVPRANQSILLPNGHYYIGSDSDYYVAVIIFGAIVGGIMGISQAPVLIRMRWGAFWWIVTSSIAYAISLLLLVWQKFDSNAYFKITVALITQATILFLPLIPQVINTPYKRSTSTIKKYWTSISAIRKYSSSKNKFFISWIVVSLALVLSILILHGIVVTQYDGFLIIAVDSIIISSLVVWFRYVFQKTSSYTITTTFYPSTSYSWIIRRLFLGISNILPFWPYR